MTHLLLPYASAFLAAPSGKWDRLPERSGGLPLLFLVFCLACAALSVVELLWPPAATAVLTFETVIIPQL